MYYILYHYFQDVTPDASLQTPKFFHSETGRILRHSRKRRISRPNHTGFTKVPSIFCPKILQQEEGSEELYVNRNERSDYLESEEVWPEGSLRDRSEQLFENNKNTTWENAMIVQTKRNTTGDLNDGIPILRGPKEP